jgi:hypothetical protein
LEKFGVTVEDRLCELDVPPETQVSADHILQSRGISWDDFLVVINPAGNWELKRWSEENF